MNGWIPLLSFVLVTLARPAGAPTGPQPQATDEEGRPQPPRAKILPHRLENHSHVRTDNYYWLNERDNPETVNYLEAENAYTSAVLKHTEPLQEELFQEIVGRIQQDDQSVPYKLDDYYYYTRFVEAADYPLYCRKKRSLEAAEEIMLDANAMAKGHEFFAMAGVRVSSGQDLLAYATDTVGRRLYALGFKNLTTGETLPDVIREVTGNVAWANDNRTVYYTKQEPQTLRWHRVYRHVLGTDPAKDELVFEETDETYNCFVYKTKSKRYLIIGSSTTLSSEYRYLDADQVTGTFKVFLPRSRGHEYSIDHYRDRFFIRTNDQAKNFRLMATSVDATGRENWEEVIPHRPDVFLEGFDIFKDHLVLTERKEGLTALRVIPWSGSGEHYIDFGEPAYLAYTAENPEFDTPLLRFAYTSMTTPRSVYDYDMNSREKKLLKRDPVLGSFDPADYVTERLVATARDGVRVPVSLVYRKGFEKTRPGPLLLYGYGSYGFSMDATFDSARLSLLDRGFAYAIAHVRGGQELGRDWYEDGKLLKKKNTFTDFIDCAEFLIGKGYTAPDRLFAMGGSAGGLLMGAVLNMRPDLFKAAVAEVPFVDVLTTMVDPSIPLTTGEYDEWGDPRQKEYYDYILSYSPYDNVEAKAFPHLLVTTGLHDSQVQYWEPAKWVAKLRALKTDSNRLLLYTNMEAGHSGASGRLKMHRETALVYAFLLDTAGARPK